MSAHKNRKGLNRNERRGQRRDLKKEVRGHAPRKTKGMLKKKKKIQLTKRISEKVSNVPDFKEHVKNMLYPGIWLN